MEKFPAEFSDFIISSPSSWSGNGRLGNNGEYVKWFPNLVKPVLARQTILLLEKSMGPYMRTWNVPISRQLITDLRYNFSESLPKTFRNDSVILNSPRAAAVAMAKRINLLQMLGSESLRRFAEICSGYTLDPEPGFQVSRYRTGDFIGPHNDHHPEDWNLRKGYVDLSITLTTPSVASQYFIYEHKGMLNRMVNVSVPSGVTVSHLPYWHQVTPLVAREGKEQEAQRWLMLVSFSIIPKNKSKN